MYENITYAELKNLPEDRKAEAWKELHIAYPDNKALAQKLGTATIAVVNSVKKYVLGEPIGRANKKNKQEPQPEQVQELQQEIKQEPQQEPQPQEEQVEPQLQQEHQREDKPKRKYNRKAKQDVVIELPESDVKIEETKPEEAKVEEVKAETTQEPQQETEQESQQEPQLPQEPQQEVKSKRKYNRKVKPDVVIELPEIDMPANNELEPVKEVSNVQINNINVDSFSITIKKIVSGEDAQFLLNGIGSTLLNDQQYSIEVKVVEK